jgi:cell division protein FtsQ
MNTRGLRRSPGHVRRSPEVRRASAARLTRARAAAALTAILAGAAIYGAASSPVFGLSRVLVDGASFTPESEVRAALDVPAATNLFRLSTVEPTRRLLALPAVRGAEVVVSLPGTLRIRLVERTAILVWAVGERRFLVDRDGLLFADLGEVDPARADGLPILTDSRATSAELTAGSALDPVILDAATRLGSLTPTDLGSEAPRLSVVLSDEHGFVVKARPDGWAAIFGFYTPTLRQPTMIPGQVRLLRSLLVDREDQVARIVLASETDGTYTPVKGAETADGDEQTP